ncbi:MAG TPA: PAS domain-containing protein [Chloroflexi bacterium]|mgnify:CR=1 FL=1|nr:PAS domain-containing protein [Chloroflexota bacterium]
MLSSGYPYDYQFLKEAWSQFVERGDSSAEGLDPAIIRSWKFCREIGLDPLVVPQAECEDAEGLDRRRQECFDLIAIARPFMEDIYQFAGEADLVVYLADASLCVLERVGDESLQDRLRQAGLSRGVWLTDDQIGTNAASLVLRNGMPAQVVGPEHFCSVYHFLTGVAAPIHAPSGEMLGTIGIVMLESKSHPYALSIVMAAARAIENQLQADESLAETHHHLLELNVALQAVNKGIIFLNAEGWITQINFRAGDILGMSIRQAMGRRLRDLITIPTELEIAMIEQASVEEREIIFQTPGGGRPCRVSLDVLWEGDRSLGFTLMLEPTAEVQRLAQRVVGTRAHFTFDDVIGQDVKIRRVLYYARTVAQSDSTVLLLGESGTGKEMFAQAIHNASRRANGPFVAINCAAIPRELMSSELFGYEGAFAVGEEGRPGKFELADGGTIFLDNVDGMSLNVQGSLLQVIDTKEIMRLGGRRVIPLDVRIIAASNSVDLENQVQQGRFRADLFYRLHVLTLTIPPLRERGNDVLLLIARLAEQFAQRLKKDVKISHEAMAVLQSYQWPGNVREMENVLERAMHIVEGNVLTLEHLPVELRSAVIGGRDQVVLTLQEAELQAIIRAGRALQGNVTQMADALGIGRTTLWRKMNRHNLSPDLFKTAV